MKHRMMSIFVVALATVASVLACAGVAAAANGLQLPSTPGARIVLTQPFFTDFVNGIVPALANQLQGMAFSDYTTSDSGFDISITQLRLATFQVPNFGIQLENSNQVQITLALNVLVTGHYDVKHGGFPHMETSGDLKAGAGNGHFQVTVALTNNAGHLEVSIVQANTDIGQFTLSFSGGIVQEIIDILIRLFNSYLQPPINRAINNALTNSANQATQRATTSYPEVASLAVPPTMQGNNDLYYSLVGAVSGTAQYLSIPVAGQTVGPNPSLVPPFQPADMPVVYDTTHHIQFLLGDYLWNAAAWVYSAEGAFELVINQNTYAKLNTTYFSTLLPNVAKLCDRPSGGCPMQIQLGILPNGPAPSIKLTQAAGMNASAELQWVVGVLQQDGKTLKPAFGLAVALDVVAKPSTDVVKNIVHLTFSFFDVAFQITSSPIGPFDPKLLNAIIEEVCNLYVVPALNSLVAPGIPIPVIGGLTLVNPVVAAMDGYLVIAANAQYNP
jgi:flagellar biosynthesis protein FliQ